MANQRQTQRTEFKNQQGNRFKEFGRAIDDKLSQYPVIGAVILDAVVIGCDRLNEYINRFEEKARDRVAQLRNNSGEA
jgi:hypothetical protein